MASKEVATSAGREGTGDWVRLNVGGTIFETTRTTIARLMSQFLDRLLAEDSGFPQPADGVYKIDRDPEVFRVLLNFARHGRLLLSPQVTTDMLSADADFYMLRQEALVAIEELSKGTAASAKGRGRKYYNLPVEILAQHLDKRRHHNALTFRRIQRRGHGLYSWTKSCPIDQCPAKLINESPTAFNETCISCHRNIVVLVSQKIEDNWKGKNVVLGWCHICLRCTDCQEIICLP